MRNYFTTSVILETEQMKQNKNFISLFLKGLAIGTAAIIPGISGGTIAFMLGIYDLLIGAIVGLRKQFQSSLSVLLPTGLGIVLAIGALTYPMGLALTYAPLPTITLFAGFILGSFPQLRKDLPKQITPIDFLYILIPAIIAASLGVLSVVGKLDATGIVEGSSVLPKISLIVVGFLGVSAFVVPGISGSMLLLSIGFYKPILESLERLLNGVFQLESIVNELVNFGLLGVGAVIGFAVISILMKTLFERYRTQVLLGVFGFIIGSLVAIFYNYEIVPIYDGISWWMVLIATITLIFGVYVSLEMNRRYAAR